MVRALGWGCRAGYIDLTTFEHLSTFWTSTLVAKYRAGRWVIRTGLRALGPDPHGEVERWTGVLFYLPSLEDVPTA
jgi:hypothetical protein